MGGYGMGRPLIIAEKPSQARKIAEAFSYQKKKEHLEILPCSQFPSGAIVTNAIGHICELAEPSDYDEKYQKWELENLPIVPERFKLKVSASKRKQFNIIKRFVNDPSIDVIINSSDPGREGQLLVDEILVLLGNKKPVKRLWTTSLTKDAIRNAFKKLKDNKEYESLYYEALARQHADWLIGINSSRAMTILLNQSGVKGTFSCGRCQTALLKLIYQREIDIENFKSEPYWDVYAEFQAGEISFLGKWFREQEEHIFDRDAVYTLAEFCKDSRGKVMSVHRKEVRQRPPQFYNLTTLQTEGNKRLGLSPSKILEIAQSLYEKGLISYPRSEPRHVTAEEAKSFPDILENLQKHPEYAQYFPTPLKDISNDRRYVDAGKTDDHYAIILTEQPVQLSQLTKHEQIIYDMIAMSMIMAHYPDCVLNQTEVVIMTAGNFSFKTKGQQVVEPGWRMVLNHKENDGEEELILPKIVEGMDVNVTGVEVKEGKTTAPSRFTQGGLVKLMENAAAYLPSSEKEGFNASELSLGTVATRASIINQILSKKYIRIEKNKVFLEPRGRILIEALKSNQVLTSPVTTGKMEQYLAKISKSKTYRQDYSCLIERTKQITHNIVESAVQDSKIWDFQELLRMGLESKSLGKCLQCGADVVEKNGFYGCCAYKETQCSFTVPKIIAGKEITPKVVTSILTKGTSPLIKGFQSKKKDNTFDAFLTWDEKNKKLIFNFDGVKS